MDRLIISIIIVIAILTGYGLGLYTHIQKKYKMNLKCIQGELYEEIKPNFYIKSHLECFEQRSF